MKFSKNFSKPYKFHKISIFPGTIPPARSQQQRKNPKPRLLLLPAPKMRLKNRTKTSKKPFKILQRKVSNSSKFQERELP
jgi:hypothetical protein